MDSFWTAYGIIGALAFAMSVAIFRPRSLLGWGESIVFGALWFIPAGLIVIAAFNGAALLREGRETPPWRPPHSRPG